ncbi:hypothetical protein MGALJ_26960 [Mycobacterium gallinarum]|uniref:Uncharacterized protein n=1 Tax=Mycobacterium gallinarum TaxID=39689 RepID=A0A9W4FFB9_9MYCO|nr:hypothetical protein MGALJ_26960 [Mycobacterium gallinarum]
MTLSPYCRAYRHDLADDRLRRETATGYDGGDVIDLDPTDHFLPLLHAAFTELINRLVAPIPTVVRCPTRRR